MKKVLRFLGCDGKFNRVDSSLGIPGYDGLNKGPVFSCRLEKFLFRVFGPSVVKVFASADFYRDYEDPAILVLGDYEDLTGNVIDDGEDYVLQVFKGDVLRLERVGRTTELYTSSDEFFCSFPWHFHKGSYRFWSDFFERLNELVGRLSKLKISRIDFDLD
jgi:hypothetical protein